MRAEYIKLRKTKRSVKYKLRKRIEKMLDMANRHKGVEGLSVLDIGAADGIMLARFKKDLGAGICVGIEPSWDFIKANATGMPIIRGIAENLPFKEGVFDLVTAASVLDHMRDAVAFLKECSRVLKKDGIVEISLVSPFYDKLAVMLGIKDADHTYHFTDKQLKEFLKQQGYSVLEVSRFGLPFFGVLFENFMERFCNTAGIKWPMFYIAACARVNK